LSIRRRDGRWEVRWREQGHNRSRRFDRRADAQAWDAEVRRRRQLGPLALAQLTTTTPTLGQWIVHHWAPEHAANLERSTRDRYANVYAVHVAPWLDDVPLGELTVGRLRVWQGARVAAGVKPGTIDKARTVLSSVLRHAAESDVIPGNPLALVRPPRATPRDTVRPLAPSVIEAIRAELLAPPPADVPASGPGQRSRRRHAGPSRAPRLCRRDALIVSLLGYAGLRPGELRALRWQDIRDRTLLIERAAAPDGTPKATKTTHARAVRLLPPLSAELGEWRLTSGRPPGEALVFPAPGGGLWTKTDWGNWRNRQWAPACRRAGLDYLPRPYDLRHSFASLLLAEGRQPMYVARQLGHSPMVLLSHYAGLVDEFEDAERVDPEREIVRARENVGTRLVPERERRELA
jgi:integrase